MSGARTTSRDPRAPTPGMPGRRWRSSQVAAAALSEAPAINMLAWPTPPVHTRQLQHCSAPVEQGAVVRGTWPRASSALERRWQRRRPSAAEGGVRRWGERGAGACWHPRPRLARPPPPRPPTPHSPRRRRWLWQATWMPCSRLWLPLPSPPAHRCNTSAAAKRRRGLAAARAPARRPLPPPSHHAHHLLLHTELSTPPTRPAPAAWGPLACQSWPRDQSRARGCSRMPRERRPARALRGVRGVWVGGAGRRASAASGRASACAPLSAPHSHPSLPPPAHPRTNVAPELHLCLQILLVRGDVAARQRSQRLGGQPWRDEALLQAGCHPPRQRHEAWGWRGEGGGGGGGGGRLGV